MGRFHEILEEEHRRFCESLENQSMIENLQNEEEYIQVSKQFLENLKDFEYWKEWKNNN